MIEKLREYGINENLLEKLKKFREFYKVDDKVKDRISAPENFYYGIDVWEKSIYALLNGQNILLVGQKATGKNVLADNLAYAFGRPRWTVSFHNYLDADDLIGVDTYADGRVMFRPGSVTNVAKYGGFGVLDEINMAKNEAVSVLYSALDHRRVIDISGYDKIDLAEETRFIATINYGYLGTRELNEALVSRFTVIRMPEMSKGLLSEIITGKYPDLKAEHVEILSSLFISLQEKAVNGQISSRSVDLRGLVTAVKLNKSGLDIKKALDICMASKVFDEYERQIVTDVINLTVPSEMKF